MNWTINQTVDLSRGYTPVVWPDALMVSGDVGAHTWRITVLDNGVPADLSGATITGSFLRDDGATVRVTGSVLGNVASVTLTDACYAVEGKLVGTMRAVISGATVTLAAVVYTVKLLTSGDVVDPGVTYQNFTIDASPAGTYADLSALISANPAHDKIYLTLNDGFWNYWNGAAFVAGGTYQAEPYFDKLEQLYNHQQIAQYKLGVISSTNGGEQSSTTRIRTVDMLSMAELRVETATGYKYFLHYYDESGSYHGHSGTWLTGSCFATDYAPPGSRYIRVVIAHADDQAIQSVDDVAANVGIYAPVHAENYVSIDSLLLRTIDSAFPAIEKDVRLELGGIFLATGWEGSYAGTIPSARLRSADYLVFSSFALQPIGNISAQVLLYDVDRQYVSGIPFSDKVIVVSSADYPTVRYFRFSLMYTNSSLETEPLGENHLPQPELLFSLKAFTNIITQPPYQDFFYENAPDVQIVNGGIQLSDGEETSTHLRKRTADLLPLCNMVITAIHANFVLRFYDAEKNYYPGYGEEDYNERSKRYDPRDYPHAKYFRIMFSAKPGYPFDESIPAPEKLFSMVSFTSTSEALSTSSFEDIPENLGMLSAVLKAKQLAELRWETVATMPHQQGDYAPGTEKTGLVYSSTKPEQLYVPLNVSLHTFMTALKNPNSFQYTVDLGDPPYNNPNGDTYYGVVCSSFVEYCLGINEGYTTYQWADIPGMELLEDQSAYGLKIGDAIWHSGHVKMVTNIERTKRGIITHITVAEAAQGGVVNLRRTLATFNAQHPTPGYKFYRYKKLYASRYTPSPYVAVEDEVEQEVTYNMALIPRRGDSANWRPGEPVVIDVLTPDTYTQVELYKNDVFDRAVNISSVITFTGLGHGNYKARLTNGTQHSEYCHWVVVDMVVSTTHDGAQATTQFASANGAPKYIAWTLPDYAHRHIHVLTPDEIADGQAVTSFKPGTWFVRVFFETAYGVIASDGVQVVIN